MILIKIDHESGTIVFDADHPYPECYFTYDKNLLRKIDQVIESAGVGGTVDVDPAPFYLEALRREFGNAELVASNWQPGRFY